MRVNTNIKIQYFSFHVWYVSATSTIVLAIDALISTSRTNQHHHARSGFIMQLQELVPSLSNTIDYLLTISHMSNRGTIPSNKCAFILWKPQPQFYHKTMQRDSQPSLSCVTLSIIMQNIRCTIFVEVRRLSRQLQGETQTHKLHEQSALSLQEMDD